MANKRTPCEFCGWSDHDLADCKIAVVFEADPTSYSEAGWKVLCDQADDQVQRSLVSESK